MQSTGSASSFRLAGLTENQSLGYLQAMRVFDDPGILKGAVKGAVLPVTSESKGKLASFAKQPGAGGLPALGGMPSVGGMPGLPFFRQMKQRTSTRYVFVSTTYCLQQFIISPYEF